MSNGQEYRYVYDDLGQLIREDNSVTNKTYVYAYDNAGNILSKKTYSLTAAGSTPSGSYTTNAYTYGDATWGDLLTKYRGVFITYDAIGNPLSYYNGSSYTFTWKNGRQLASATKGSTTLSFDYNDEGIRTKKVVNGVEHTYYLSGSQIEAEKWGNNLCITVYNFEVQDYHTYFITHSEILVHNANCDKMGTPKGNMTGNHEVQNKQVRDALKSIGQDTPKNRRILHDAIHGMGYGYQEVLDEAIQIFGKKK